jgi:hypothetical protein
MHGNLTIEYCDVHSNAISAQSHNLYLHSDPGTVARIQYNLIRDPFHPMNGLKSRAARNEVYYNYFYNNGQAMELISNGTASPATPFDSDVVGNFIVSTDPRRTMGIRLCGDNTGPGTYGRYRVTNNTFAFLHTGRATMIRFNQVQWLESAEFYNNIFFSRASSHLHIFSPSTQGKWVAGGRVSGANNWVSSNADRSTIVGTEEFKTIGWDAGIYEFTGVIFGDDPGFVNPNGNPWTGLDVSLRSDSRLSGAGVPFETLKVWPSFDGGRSPFIFPNPLTILNRQPVNPAAKNTNGVFINALRCVKKNPDIGAYGICP